MKKKLNQFAIWLFGKTKETKNPDIASLYGMKVIMSDFIPKDTIMMGRGDGKKVIGEFKKVEINDKYNNKV